MAGNVVSNVKKYYGGQVPVPGQGDSDGKVKVLVEKTTTVEIEGVQTDVNLLYDADDLTVPVTPQKLGQWTDRNYLIAFKTRDGDEGVVRGFILYALGTDSTSSDTLVNRATFVAFKGDMTGDPGASAFEFTMVEDSSTLARYLMDENGEMVVRFNKSCVEAGAQSGTLDELIETDSSALYFEVVHEGDNAYLVLNTQGLGEIIDDIHSDLDFIIDALDELPSDEHGYFNSSVYATPGDGTTTNLVMGEFRISEGRDIHGESIEFVPTRQEGGVDFGEVYLEPGTYILAIQYTLQWVGNPRGTFLPLVTNVADQPFDFSYEHEDVVRVTRIVTRTTRGKLVTNIAIDADTPPMGVWVKSLEVIQVASYNHSAVAHDTTLTGSGKVSDPLGVTPAAFGKVKDIPTSISQFRTGDVILVDGPNGPAKMGKDDLLTETSQNALENSDANNFVPSDGAPQNSYVVHEGVLYKVLEDIAPNEGFTLAKVKKLNALYEFPNWMLKKNLMRSGLSSEGGYYRGYGDWGAPTYVTDSSYGMTSLAPVIPGITLFAYRRRVGNNSFGPYFPNTHIVLYDKSKTPILALAVDSYTRETITLPNDIRIAYMAIPISIGFIGVSKCVYAIGCTPIDGPQDFNPSEEFFRNYSEIKNVLGTSDNNTISQKTISSALGCDNLINFERVTLGGYYNNNQFVTHSTYGCTDLIPVEPGDKLYYKTDSRTSWSGGLAVQYFDENKDALLSIYPVSYSEFIVVPSGAKYVSIPLSYDNIDKCCVCLSKTRITAPALVHGEFVKKLLWEGSVTSNYLGDSEDKAISQKVMSGYLGPRNLIDFSKVIVGYFYSGSGWVARTDIASTDFIPVEPGEKLYRASSSSTVWNPRSSVSFFSDRVDNPPTDDPTPYRVAYAYTTEFCPPEDYDENGSPKYIIVPPAAKYLLVPFSKSLGQNIAISRLEAMVPIKDNYNRKRLMWEGDVVPEANQWEGKKWYAYGTSITDTTPTGKYLPYLATMSGMIATDKGIGGGGIGNLGAYSQGQVFNAICNTTDGKLEADLITLETGANDVNSSVPLGTIYDDTQDTLAGCLNLCIRYLQANTNAQIAIMPSVATTTKPNETSQYYKWQMMIRDICFINRVFFIEPACNLGYGKLTSSNGSLYVVDSIHQTSLGGYILAEAMWEQIKRIPNFRTVLPS